MEVLTLYKMPEGNGEVDVTAKARELIDQARQLFEAGPEKAEAAEERSIDATESAAIALMMAGKNREVQALGAATNEPSERLRDTIAWSFIGEANQLVDKAKAESRAEADRLFAEAGAKYEAALAIKPDDHGALNNWGNALSDQANTKDGAEADRLFAEASEKYQAALAIEPDFHIALNNWGTASLDMARKKDGVERQRVLDLAVKKLGDGLNRGWTDLLYNLACASALKGDIEAARRHLISAKEHNALPEKVDIESDSDLSSLRKEPWFRELLDSLDVKELPRTGEAA